MSISIIAAVAKNGVIGKENALPWYLPEDLKRFRALTTGKTVLMGRKTFESIMHKLGKPLPNRTNIVITRDKGYQIPITDSSSDERVVVYNNLNKAIEDYKDRDLFIIGGGQIYKQTIDLADVLYITHVDQEIDGDVYFPEIDLSKWQKVEEEKHEGFSFTIYQNS